MRHATWLFAVLALFFAGAPVLAQNAPGPEITPSLDVPVLPHGADRKDGKAALPPAPRVYTLEEAVQRGLAANPSIVAARAATKAAAAGESAALGELGFKVDTTYGLTRYDEELTSEFGGASFVTREQDIWSWTLRVTQPIFTGFRLLSSYQRASLSRDETRARLRAAELGLVQAIQSSFFNLLKARMDVKSALDSVERLRSQLKVTTAFFDVGLQPRLDVLQAEVELATAEQDLLRAQNAVSTQTARLNSLLNLPLRAEVNYRGELSFVPFPLTLEQAVTAAFENRPDLEIARKSVEIAGKEARIAASGFYPQISAQFNYTQQGSDPSVDGFDTSFQDDKFWNVQAGMEWNLFEWGATYNSYRQASMNVSRLEAEAANTRLEAAFEVKSNILAIQEAADRIGVAKKSLAAAREGFRMSQARYQAQVGTNTDVLDAQSRVSQSEAQLSQALADYRNALANLYVSMGVMKPAFTD